MNVIGDDRYRCQEIHIAEEEVYLMIFLLFILLFISLPNVSQKLKISMVWMQVRFIHFTMNQRYAFKNANMVAQGGRVDLKNMFIFMKSNK